MGQVLGRPSVLSPWYVVQQFRSLGMAGVLYFYCSQDIAEIDCWTEQKKDAMIFESLRAAARVAEAEEAHVRVLVTDKDAKEFNR